MLKQFKSSVLLAWLSPDITFCKTEFRLVYEEPIGHSGLNVSLHICAAYCRGQDLGNGVNVTYYNYFKRMKIWTFVGEVPKRNVKSLCSQILLLGFHFFSGLIVQAEWNATHHVRIWSKMKQDFWNL